MQSEVFRALADPTRRDILCLLGQGEMTVGEVADHFEMSRPAVAKHLRVLGEGGLVVSERRGRKRINRLDPRPLNEVRRWLDFFDRFWDQRLANLKREIENER